jgi:hypothetical protein
MPEGDQITPPATNPPPASAPPAEPPAPPAPPAPPRQDGTGSVLAAVNALPERLVDAVRELIPQQPPAPQQPAQQQSTQDTPPASTPPASAASSTPNAGKRRSVGEWFLGMPKRG